MGDKRRVYDDGVREGCPLRVWRKRVLEKGMECVRDPNGVGQSKGGGDIEKDKTIV